MADKKNVPGGSETGRGYLDSVGYDPDSVLGRSSAGKMDDVEIDSDELTRSGQGRRPGMVTVIIVIVIMLLAISTLFAASTISDTGSDTISDTAEYELFMEVLASSELNYEQGPGSGYFEAGRVMSVQGADLKAGLAGDNKDLRDYEFSVEIIDVSDYPVHYTRSSTENNVIESGSLPEGDDGGSAKTFETAVNIFVNDNEVHSARFIMYIWKN